MLGGVNPDLPSQTFSVLHRRLLQYPACVSNTVSDQRCGMPKGSGLRDCHILNTKQILHASVLAYDRGKLSTKKCHRDSLSLG